jgi:superfamily I DNA and/or RNA helicase
VPLDDGLESYCKPSRIREAEAEVIAREAKRLLDAAGDAASIGVITFYSAQRDLILEKLARLGVVENGEITPEYSRNRHGEERLRVGTVDAFQGKEFDVVLLSIVRASKKVIPTNAEKEKREAALNSKYGHLRLSNRMNVAMSRQRNLLITVGAIAMANTQEAKEAVPSLHNFLTLCRGEYGCIR